MHLEYVVYAFLVVAFTLLAVAIAILFPHLQRERRADAAETRALHGKSTTPDHDA